MRNRDSEWVAKALLITVAAMAIGFLVAGWAGAADFTLLPIDACQRCDRAYKRCKADNCPTPTPSAVPTAVPTPTPTVAQNCSDGTFLPSSNPAVMQWVNRIYEPGRPYNLCAKLPAGTTHMLTLSSNNHANTSCNDFTIALKSPSQKLLATNGTQPGVGASFEPGLWQIVLVLKNDPQSLCAKNEPLDLFMSFF